VQLTESHGPLAFAGKETWFYSYGDVMLIV
jgi:hypothetical protein